MMVWQRGPPNDSCGGGTYNVRVAEPLDGPEQGFVHVCIVDDLSQYDCIKGRRAFPGQGRPSERLFSPLQLKRLYTPSLAGGWCGGCELQLEGSVEILQLPGPLSARHIGSNPAARSINGLTLYS